MYFSISRLFWCSVFALMSCSLLSCSVIIKSTIKDNGVQMPPDFGEEDVTILAVKSGGRRYNKALGKVFAKSYKGKYLLVTPNELDDTTYSDISEYRYVFDKTVLAGTYSYNPSTHATVGMGYMKFQLYDRLTGKTYQTKTGMSSYAKLMGLYLQVLDKKRTRYNGHANMPD